MYVILFLQIAQIWRCNSFGAATSPEFVAELSRSWNLQKSTTYLERNDQIQVRGQAHAGNPQVLWPRSNIITNIYHNHQPQPQPQVYNNSRMQ